MSSLVIEAWIAPLSTITPSLIVHNLELHGIRLPQLYTVIIDRGHYDCTGTNYTVIAVCSSEPLPVPAPAFSFCCSFFSQQASRGMDPVAMCAHWLGNCYVHLDAADALCSFRYESGRSKTWRKAEVHDPVQATVQDPVQDPVQEEDAVSVEPVSVPLKPKSKSKSKTKYKHKYKHLLSELDALKAELRDVKAYQRSWVKRSNQCMQDWTNLQVIERVRILEAQQQQHQPKKCKCKCKCKKEMKQVNCDATATATATATQTHACNPCNPFDFNAIYDYFECPALDLIANHYPDYAPSTTLDSLALDSLALDSLALDSLALDAADDSDDMFEIVQIFDLPSK